jgi:hypothetical protein
MPKKRVTTSDLLKGKHLTCLRLEVSYAFDQGKLQNIAIILNNDKDTTWMHGVCLAKAPGHCVEAHTSKSLMSSIKLSTNFSKKYRAP